jgi:hypothetical protein
MGAIVSSALNRLHNDSSRSIDRFFDNFPAVTPAIAQQGEGAQKVLGTVISPNELIAPLSGHSCVYYKVEALEFTEVDDRLDWREVFREERSVSFNIRDGQHAIYVNGAPNTTISCLSDPVVEMHTGEEAFPTDFFGLEEELVCERAEDEDTTVFVFEAVRAQTHPDGIRIEGIPIQLKQFLERRRFHLYGDEDSAKQPRRMRFIERTIEHSKAYKFVGTVAPLENVIALTGTNRFRLDALPHTQVSYAVNTLVLLSVYCLIMLYSRCAVKLILKLLFPSSILPPQPLLLLNDGVAQLFSDYVLLARSYLFPC